MEVGSPTEGFELFRRRERNLQPARHKESKQDNLSFAEGMRET